MSIHSEQRKRYILAMLEREHRVMVTEAAEKLGVSAESIRRDLVVLENEGRLKRVYGGAVRPMLMSEEAPYEQRQSVHASEKKLIGRLAAQTIEDGSTILLDVGTTTLELAKAIQGFKRLTILTNSLPAAAALGETVRSGRLHATVMLLGGTLNAEQQSLTGPLCERVLRDIRVDRAFLSCGGVSLEHGITDYDLNEASCSRLIALCAEHVTVVADHSKLGVRTFIHVAELEDVDTIICDEPPPKEWGKRLKEAKVKWLDVQEQLKDWMGET